MRVLTVVMVRRCRRQAHGSFSDQQGPDCLGQDLGVHTAWHRPLLVKDGRGA